MPYSDRRFGLALVELASELGNAMSLSILGLLGLLPPSRDLSDALRRLEHLGARSARARWWR